MFRTLILLPVALLSGLAFAGDPPAAPAEEAEKTAEAPAAEAPAAAEEALPEFADLDKDASKAIDAAEAKEVEALVAVFATVDADKSGGLSKSEFDAWSKAKKVN